MRSVVAQRFFRGRKFPGGPLPGLLFGSDLLGLLMFFGKFALVFHNSIQAYFLNRTLKALRARCNFPRTASGDCSVSMPTCS